MKAYLIMMGIRMLEMRRVLKDTGSIYLHCDPTASHYLKIVMDSLFGTENFRNEVVWQRTNAHNDGKQYGRVHDVIMFYSKSGKTTWNPVYIEHDPDYIKKFYRHEDERGLYQVGGLSAPGITQEGESGKSWRGVNPSDVGRHWSAPRRESCPKDVKLPENYESLSVHEKLDALDANGLIYFPPRGRVPRFKQYLSTSKGRRIHDIITDIKSIASQSKERTGYPTQKPLALLERIIKASSNENDVVLDPFCGCATTCIAAEALQRQWIGIDLSPKAVELVKMRLVRDLKTREDRANLIGDQVIHRTDIPTRLHPDPAPDIQQASLFGVQSDIEIVLSQVQLRQFRSYKHTLFGLQEGKCNGCAVLFPFRNMTIDHITPRSKGGTDDPDNLQLLCGACNSTKGNRTQDELIQSLREQGVLRE